MVIAVRKTSARAVSIASVSPILFSAVDGIDGASPSELTVSEFSEERWRRKSNTYGEVSEKCSRTEAFPVDSTPGRESAFGFRVPDGQRRTNSPVPARAV